MTTPFWLEVIKNLPDHKLIEWAVRNRRSIRESTRFLSRYPDDDPWGRGSPEIKKAIASDQEDLDLILAELDRRSRPGPRDWSPRGESGVPKVRVPWE